MVELLSTRLARQHFKLEQELRELSHPTEQVNPMHLLSCGAWGESNYWIEDSVQDDGRQSAGLIRLQPIQHRILNLALSMRIDYHIEDGEYVLHHHLEKNASTPTSGGQSATTPTSGGSGSKKVEDDDDGESVNKYIYIGVLSTRLPISISNHTKLSSNVLQHHHHHLLDNALVIYRDTIDSEALCLSIDDRVTDWSRVVQAIILCQVLRFRTRAPGTCNFRSPGHPLNLSTLPTTDSISLDSPLVISKGDDIGELAERLGVGLLYKERIERVLEGRDARGVLEGILRQAKFRWSTIVWSCPKKSGKTRVAAMVASWLAWRSGRFSEIYCIANDGKQSSDRVLRAIKRGITLAKESNEGGRGSKSVMSGWDDKSLVVTLPKGQFIEAIPVDPTGEAGGQPTGTFWSEMWGYSLEIKERLWTELTIPPTRWGYAIRWVESYAGYEGESGTLWNLYVNGVDSEEYPAGQGVKHPESGELPIYVNPRLGQFTYWDHEARMPWQTEKYYEAEAGMLSEQEFRRIHKNEWASPEGEVIPIERWDALKMKMPVVGKKTPLVLGVDLSVSGDCTALVVVSMLKEELVGIRAVQVWEPTPGHKIDYTMTIEKAIRYWCENFNVVTVVYDPYQAHKMVTDLRREGVAWFQEFAQGKGSKGKPGRPIGDKMFFDFVMSGKLRHGGDPVMREHIVNTVAEVKGEHHMRFVRRRTEGKIDSVVAASMAVCVISRLNLDEEDAG